MVPWKTVGVTIKASAAPEFGELLRRVAEQISRSGCELLLAGAAAEQVPGAELCSLDDVAARADLLIVLGGDGSMLRAARAIGLRDVALFGINLGRLGFLTDVRPEEVADALEAVLAGRYRIVSRSRLCVTQLRSSGEEPPRLVSNDAVISAHGDVARMVDLETSVAGRRMGGFRADGLIVSTPTGSTAYSLGAGGSILDPEVDAIIVTPICPLATTQQRPIVLSDRWVVEVLLHSEFPALLTLDGQVGLALQQGEGIRVARSAHPLRFVTVGDHDYFEILRTKLHWGSP
jgi:NAD+ kinase